MPNCCYGTLSIYASKELLETILATLQGTNEEEGNPFDFNKVIPMPDYIYRGDIGLHEQELYGKNNWYDWSIENWGTKWNSCDTELEGNVLSFWTAWGPCSPVIRVLAKMFPEAQFEYQYEENGMGFCGCQIYKNGVAQYIMVADLEESFIYDDEDDNKCRFDDYKEGRKEETITIFGIIDGVKQGKIERREDNDDYVRIIKGEFVERIDNGSELTPCA